MHGMGEGVSYVASADERPRLAGAGLRYPDPTRPKRRSGLLISVAVLHETIAKQAVNSAAAITRWSPS